MKLHSGGGTSGETSDGWGGSEGVGRRGGGGGIQQTHAAMCPCAQL